MAYWLLKTEPETFGWDDQVKRGAKGEPWSGVRNFTARDNLRSMKKGELAFFYHTGKEKAVVGIVKVIKEAYPDHTAKEPFWSMVDVIAVEPFPRHGVDLFKQPCLVIHTEPLHIHHVFADELCDVAEAVELRKRRVCAQVGV